MDTSKILCPYCGVSHPYGTACKEVDMENEDLLKLKYEFLESNNVDVEEDTNNVELPVLDVEKDKQLKIFMLEEQVKYLKDANNRLRTQLNKKKKSMRRKKRR